MKMMNKILSASVLCTVMAQTSSANELSNFNEPNVAKLNSAIQNRKVHIIQFGDSHTAADVMTGVMRTQLQSTLGNGGMGWGMPMYFAGQRLELYGYDNSGWQPISSRTNHNENYSLGGLLAVPKFSGATLTIKAKQSQAAQNMMVSLRQASSDGAFSAVDATGKRFSIEAPIKNNSWKMVKFTAVLPFTITANNVSNSAIGGWWGENASGGGAIVSALGINGAELSNWNHWNSEWRNELAAVAPDLVILAYGTNEAYNDNLNVEQAKSILMDKIQKIRQASPNTAVMIVSAPESLKNTVGECGSRPVKLTAVQNMQYQVAQSMHTLYWNWQQAMGGSCSMKKWIGQGLGRSDGVHFSSSGYNKIGKMMANDLLNLSGVPASQGGQTEQALPNQNISTMKTGFESLGFAQICLEGSNECKSIGR